MAAPDQPGLLANLLERAGLVHIPSVSSDRVVPSSTATLEYLRPPIWAQPYLPRYLQESSYRGLVDPGAPLGTLKPLVKPVQEFPITDPDRPEFTKRSERAFFSDMVIRDESGEQLSPAQWLKRSVMKPGDMTNIEADALVFGVSQHLSGQKFDEAFAPAAKAVLSQLKSQGVGGEQEVFPGQTSAQQEARRTSELQESRYMTSEGMKQNLNATRAYNILAAFEESPELRPDWSTQGSGIQSLPAMLNLGAYNTPGDPGHDARHLAYLRNMHSTANPAEARMKEALYWDKTAETGAREGQYRDGMFGGYYPQTSWMTGEGMTRQAELDKANFMTYAEKVKDQAFSGSPVYGLGEDHAGLRQLMANLDREVPHLPEGLDPAEAKKARDDLRSYTDFSERRYVNEYPLYQEAYNKAISPLGRLGESLKATPSFPSPANNNVAMAPKYWMDVPTLGTLGTLGLANPRTLFSKQGFKSLAADFGAEQVTTEQPYAAAMYTSEAPYNTQPSKLFEPMPFGDVTKTVTKGGATSEVPVAANDPDYRQHWKAREGKQAKLLEGLLDFQKKWYPLQGESRPPASPSAQTRR